MNYYNEWNPFCVDWLTALRDAGHIPNGTIDGRSITDVEATDIVGYRQWHLFAGIGGWCEALRLAGWPEDREVFTFSCPCQPYSVAGKGLGDADERNLWPHARRLIAECKPAVCFGEQTQSPDGLRWFSGVRANLEALGFRVGGADLCSPCVGAPHKRQRIYFGAVRVADAKHDTGCTSDVGEQGRREPTETDAAERGCDGGMVNTVSAGLEGHSGDGTDRDESGRYKSLANGPTAETGAWSDTKIIECLDGKHRRSESGVQPLASRVSRSVGQMQSDVQKLVRSSAGRNRKGRIEGYGNSIVPQVGAMFIRAFMAAAEESGKNFAQA